MAETRNPRAGAACSCRCCQAARAFDVDDHQALVDEVVRLVNADAAEVLTWLPPGRLIGPDLALKTLLAIANARGDGDLPPPSDRSFVVAAADRLYPRSPIASRLAVRAVLAALASIKAAGTAA